MLKICYKWLKAYFFGSCSRSRRKNNPEPVENGPAPFCVYKILERKTAAHLVKICTAVLLLPDPLGGGRLQGHVEPKGGVLLGNVHLKHQHTYKLGTV